MNSFAFFCLIAVAFANAQTTPQPPVQQFACPKQASPAPGAVCTSIPDISYNTGSQLTTTVPAVSAMDCYNQCYPLGNHCKAYTYFCGTCYFINVANPPASIPMPGAVSVPMYQCTPEN